jgi:hypothetical protein
VRAADAARLAFARVTPGNTEDTVELATVAHVDTRGRGWSLGHWASMTTVTIGRQATSRGITDAVGTGGRVMVQVSGCDYCAEFEGEAVIGTDPMPPFHPSCTCVAVPA